MALQDSGPINITKGGIYTGLKIKTTSASDNAITVSTYDPVEIYGNEVEGPGKHIHAYGGTKMNVHHNKFKGTVATGDQLGRVVDVYHPQTFVFENNEVDHTGGIRVDHMDENTKLIRIRYNKFLNTDKRKPDGSEGDHRASILLDGIVGVEGEISWNYFENQVGKSWVEDNINLRNSGGTKNNWFKIHNNYIKGAYPFPLDYKVGSFTGSGITVEGDPATTDFNKVAQYVHIYNNVVLSTMNGGINVNHGHDHLVEGNTIISSGRVPSGEFSKSFWGGGAIWNGSNLSDSVYFNIIYRNNTVGYYREGVSVGGTNRQDWVRVTENNNKLHIDPALNISLPNPITLEMENAELPKWQDRVKANGITVGLDTVAEITTTSSTTTTSTTIPPDVIYIGQKKKLRITPVDKFGKAAPAEKIKTMVVLVDDKEAITLTAMSPLYEVTALKEGIHIITVDLITSSGKQIKKTMEVNILAAEDEVVDIIFQWED